MSDIIAPIKVHRWDTGTLTWVRWDGSLTTGALVIGKVDQGTAGASKWLVTADIAASQTLGTVTTVSAVTAITNALPAGTNNIGDVDILSNPFATRSDTYTGTGNGTTIDRSTSPLALFGISVKQTGTVTSWDVRLEGSLNNSEFTTILTHTNVTGDGVVLWSGTLNAPTLYFRSRCAGLVLGAGTNVVVTVLGQN